MHQEDQIPMTLDTPYISELVVFKPKILLGIPKKRFYFRPVPESSTVSGGMDFFTTPFPRETFHVRKRSDAKQSMNPTAGSCLHLLPQLESLDLSCGSLGKFVHHEYSPRALEFR